MYFLGSPKNEHGCNNKVLKKGPLLGSEGLTED